MNDRIACTNRILVNKLKIKNVIGIVTCLKCIFKVKLKKSRLALIYDKKSLGFILRDLKAGTLYMQFYLAKYLETNTT